VTPWLPDMNILLATDMNLETMGIPPRGFNKRVILPQYFNRRPTMQLEIMNQILLIISKEL
jgi:hypothetical protein